MIMVMIDGDDGDDDGDGDDKVMRMMVVMIAVIIIMNIIFTKIMLFPKDRKKHYLCPQCHIFTPMNKNVHNISLESRFEHVC